MILVYVGLFFSFAADEENSPMTNTFSQSLRFSQLKGEHVSHDESHMFVSTILSFAKSELVLPPLNERYFLLVFAVNYVFLLPYKDFL